MTNKPLITDEIKEFIGRESETVRYEVEKGAILKLIRALGLDDLEWTNNKVSLYEEHKETPAPPAFLMALPVHPPRVSIPEHLKRQVGGGSEWLFFSSVKIGDVIDVKCKVVDIYEKEGRQGKLLFILYETTYKSSLGELIAINRTPLIRY